MMQDIQVTRQSDFVGSQRLAVDPALISALLKCSSNKQGQNSQKSKARNQKRQPVVCPMNSSGYFGATPEKTRPASEASDTTRDPFDNYFDSSESESLCGSGGGSSNGFERHEARLPRANKLSMPRQPGLQIDFNVARAKATNNSSPADFAAAWTHAASTGAWKREGKKQRGVGQNRQQKASKAVAQEHLVTQHDCNYAADAEDTKDMPLPKWFAPAAQNCPKLLAREITLPAQAANRTQPPAPSDQPLKIFVPGHDSDRSHLNPEMPVKKRVPDWEF
jgi:hypothetical protein|eukprot:CAMPEP_0169104874 /NCGR_PEP_ID=MMETSP1015-20121227/23493_1 /TAXON_ID=342587 /ORGANISM="Karlodinium micrum, Strain CCMP2283" /LENGTH=277 /DNA_ID=CAMNT_0009166191 /DNA_START=89 /DNA_END=922 /DNA_ORIENTATION=-